MARMFFAVAAILSVGQWLFIANTALVSGSKENTVEWQIRNSSGRDKSSRPTVTKLRGTLKEKPKLCQSPKKWPQICLPNFANRSDDDLRKQHLSLVAEKIFDQYVYKKVGHAGIRGRTECSQLRGRDGERKRLASKNENDRKMKKRIFFPQLVKRQRKATEVSVKFRLSGADVPRNLASVKLWVLNACKRRPPKGRLFIRLYDETTQEKNCGSLTISLYQRKTHDKRSNYKGWVSFNITMPVRVAWNKIRHTCENAAGLGLSLEANGLRCISAAGGKKRRPYLEMVSPNKITSRTSPVECTPGETRCCLQRGFVNVTDMGEWAWKILAPRRFTFNYCKGKCSDDWKTHGDRPCCAPTKTSPLSILLFNSDNNVILSKVSDVVVNQCGCM